MNKLFLTVACVLSLSLGALIVEGTYQEACSGVAHAEDAPTSAASATEPAPVPLPVMSPVPDGGPVTAISAPESKIPPPVDPIDHPTEAAGQLRDFYKEMGIAAAIVFTLFMLATMVTRRVLDGHWLRSLGGRGGAITAAVTSSLSLVLAGMTHELKWPAVIVGVIMAGFSVLRPVPPTATAK